MRLKGLFGVGYTEEGFWQKFSLSVELKEVWGRQIETIFSRQRKPVQSIFHIHRFHIIRAKQLWILNSKENRCLYWICTWHFIMIKHSYIHNTPDTECNNWYRDDFKVQRKSEWITHKLPFLSIHELGHPLNSWSQSSMDSEHNYTCPNKRPYCIHKTVRRPLWQWKKRWDKEVKTNR